MRKQLKLWSLLVAVMAFTALVLGACGDNTPETPDGPLPGDFLDRLRALPGVHDAQEQPTGSAGFRYFVVHFEQPVDHDDPQSPTFLHELRVLAERADRASRGF